MMLELQFESQRERFLSWHRKVTDQCGLREGQSSPCCKQWCNCQQHPSPPHTPLPSIQEETSQSESDYCAPEPIWEKSSMTEDFMVLSINMKGMRDGRKGTDPGGCVEQFLSVGAQTWAEASQSIRCSYHHWISNFLSCITGSFHLEKFIFKWGMTRKINGSYTYWIHGYTGSQLLVDLLEFVSKDLTILSSHDAVDLSPKNLHVVLLQHPPPPELHTWNEAEEQSTHQHARCGQPNEERAPTTVESRLASHRQKDSIRLLFLNDVLHEFRSNRKEVDCICLLLTLSIGLHRCNVGIHQHRLNLLLLKFPPHEWRPEWGKKTNRSPTFSALTAWDPL